MARLQTLPTYHDPRGDLTVIEKVLPFEVQRVYYIYHVTAKRGGHRHKQTYQAFVCLNGGCEVFCDNGATRATFTLERPDQLLLVPPEDWHTMSNFSPGSILLVLASHPYDPNDYIHDAYESYRQDHDID